MNKRNNPIHQTTTKKNMWLSILDSEQLNSHFEFILFPFWQLVKFIPSHPQSLVELFRWQISLHAPSSNKSEWKWNYYLIIRCNLQKTEEKQQKDKVIWWLVITVYLSFSHVNVWHRIFRCCVNTFIWVNWKTFIIFSFTLFRIFLYSVRFFSAARRILVITICLAVWFGGICTSFASWQARE
jgi:hypothetical protein